MKLIKIVAVSILVALAFGCVRQEALESKREGECIELLINHNIWQQRENVYRSHFLLVPVSSNQPGQWSKKVGELRAGERVEVFEFVDARDGTSGFLRIKVRVSSGSNSGLIADVPACVPYHPLPSWVVGCPRRPYDVKFNPELVGACNT